MTTKRPWTGGPYKAEPHHRWEGEWEVVTNDGKTLCEVNSEADSRLFAAAPQLYDVMEALLYDPYSMIRDSIRKKAEEVILAANPAAFDGEGE